MADFGITEIGLASLALTGVSTAVGVAGAISSSNQKSAQDSYNAQVAQNEATENDAQTAFNVASKRRSLVRAQGSLDAAYGASGVVGGSSNDAFYDSLITGESDIASTQYQGQLQSNAYLDRSALYSSAASNAQSSGLLDAGTDVLSGAEKGYKIYSSDTGTGVQPYVNNGV